jgi:dTMP kinase
MGKTAEEGTTLAGRLIVIEGLDGSGKDTQAMRLYEALRQEGLPVQKISFPNYDSDSSALVKMYLAGDFGKDPASVNAYAASTFFAVDRYASFKQNWGSFYQEGGIIIADRYTTSNAVHQCSKLPQDQWDEYLHWLFHFEYRLMGIPAPDTVVYLRVDPEVSQQLMTQRYRGDESKKDIHESNAAYLSKSQLAAGYCARTLGWKTIQCVKDGAMRAIEDIAAEIRALVGL